MKDVLSAGYGIGVLAVAWLAAGAVVRWSGVPPVALSQRNQALDGLRGYLALGVLLHHAALWHHHLRTEQWGRCPPAARTPASASSACRCSS